MSKALHDLLSSGSKEVNMLGVDLDPVLVDRAKEKWPNVDSIDFQTLDVMDVERRDQIWRQYLHDRTQRQRFDVQ